MIVIESVVSEMTSSLLGFLDGDIIKLKWIASSPLPHSVSVPASGIQERGVSFAEGAR